MGKWGVKKWTLVLLLTGMHLDLQAAVEPQLDAEAVCAGPLRSFQAKLNGKLNVERQAAPLKLQMLQLLDDCQNVVEQQIGRLSVDFQQLPDDSQCQQGLSELEPFVPLFTDMRQQINAQALNSHALRRDALEYFRVIAPGVLRAVNGVFLHRYAVCEPEAEQRQHSILR
ncbi:MAG: hypothetical protein V7756_10065 [Halopseudomonas sp.]|uniref:hypothetical protein n=1 Tax=Halopseudomonas sp. TaxID=2901191 RepID=UPI003001EA24